MSACQTGLDVNGFHKRNSSQVSIRHVALFTLPIMCCFRKYPYPSHRGFFGFIPCHVPLWKFQFCFILSFKILASVIPPPLPLGISNDPPWGGYGYFLELHNPLHLGCTGNPLFAVTTPFQSHSSLFCFILIPFRLENLNMDTSRSLGLIQRKRLQVSL